MRKRTVFQACPVSGEPDALRAAFTGEPAAWLPDPHTTVDGDRYTVHLEGAHISRPVLVTVGPPSELGEVTWRMLGWQPASSEGDGIALDRVLPSFAGEIGLRTAEAPTLVVEGAYEPPLGRLGRGLDAAVLHRVADRTVRGLVVAVAKRLAAPAAVQH